MAAADRYYYQPHIKPKLPKPKAPIMNSVSGRLTMAYKALEEVPPNVIKKHGRLLRELDLSNNFIQYPWP